MASNSSSSRGDAEAKSFELTDAIASLRNREEVEEFLADLCTPCELRAMSERWRAVQLVYDEVPYRRICELTGVSTATVTRVARALSEGSGYETLIHRLRNRKAKV